MAARSDFWLVLHQLASCLAAEGQTSQERLESVASALVAMPKAARVEMKRELSAVLDDLVALPPVITAQEARKTDSGFFNFLKDLPQKP
ncbi:MAG TPA: hypothetical protein VFB96_12405 [Pirellulaceae bacterium]|jgi:hypothetical protein|nr:hypothetical protein [Pirellulaceae bacterium]